MPFVKRDWPDGSFCYSRFFSCRRSGKDEKALGRIGTPKGPKRGLRVESGYPVLEVSVEKRDPLKKNIPKSNGKTKKCLRIIKNHHFDIFPRGICGFHINNDLRQ